MSATLPSVGALRLTASADAADHELAALAATGDPRAFEHLYDRYAPRVLNLCERILGSGHDAADATQETFIRMLRRLPGLDLREASFAPYLFTAARHVCFDQMQRGARADVVDEIDEGGAPVGGRDAAPAMEDPERSALIADSQADVRDACARLNPRHREVLYLREVEELSYDDIGRVMDLNANAVAQLISRARLRLRDELRGTALASFARAGEDCTRATTLLSSVVDGKRCGEDDASWLLEHLDACDACRLAKESLAEAGRSYRLLAPIVPLEVLRRTTLAEAAEPLAELRAAHERGGPGDGSGGGAAAGGIDGAVARAGRLSRRRLAAAAGLIAVLASLLVAAPTQDDRTPVLQVREAGAPGVVPADDPAGEPARGARPASPSDPDRPVSSTGEPAPAVTGADAAQPGASGPAPRRRGAGTPRRGTARPGTPGPVGPAVPQRPVTSVPPVGSEPVPPVGDPVAPTPEPPAATQPQPEPEPSRPEPTRPEPAPEEPPTRTTPTRTTPAPTTTPGPTRTDPGAG